MGRSFVLGGALARVSLSPTKKKRLERVLPSDSSLKKRLERVLPSDSSLERLPPLPLAPFLRERSLRKEERTHQLCVPVVCLSEKGISHPKLPMLRSGFALKVRKSNGHNGRLGRFSQKWFNYWERDWTDQNATRGDRCPLHYEASAS